MNYIPEQFYRNNSGFWDVLIDLFINICETKDEYLYLADKLSEASGDYYSRLAADLYLKCGEGERFAELQVRKLCWHDCADKIGYRLMTLRGSGM